MTQCGDIAVIIKLLLSFVGDDMDDIHGYCWRQGSRTKMSWRESNP